MKKDIQKMEQERTSLLNCLKKRKDWYIRAIDMANGVIEWDNHFNWPDTGVKQNICLVYKWQGAAHELQNTIDMIEHDIKH